VQKTVVAFLHVQYIANACHGERS